MIEFTIGELSRACKGSVLHGGSGLTEDKITYITTDTREIREDDACENRAKLFVALKGERFDGNDFVEEVAKRGVGAAICSIAPEKAEEISRLGAAVFTVEDTLVALGEIAAAHRAKFNVPVVAVTGSVGKTSTKEIVASVLSTDLNVLKTKANFNNEIGLPKTLFGLSSEHEAVVAEMGMRGLGQIDYLCEIAKPEVCVVTNVGIAHMELLGSRENILRAKLEIGGTPTCRKLILNGDDEMLSQKDKVLSVLEEYGNTPEIIYYGTGENCSYRAEKVFCKEESCEFTLVTPWGSRIVTLFMPGMHNVYNALAASAVGFTCGLSLDKIAGGIELFGKGEGSTLRQKIERLPSGITLIDDTYNAGPESMKASLSVLTGLSADKGGRYVAVLGDMLELGSLSEAAHYGVGEFAAKAGVSLLITVGERMKEAVKGYFDTLPGDNTCNAISFENSKEAACELGELIKSGDAVLVKGSHAMEMPTCVEAIKNILK